MKRWRKAGLGAGLALVLVWAGCGDTFRPVATPIGPPGPDPQPALRAFVLHQGPATGTCADDSTAPCVGATSEINVSGESNMANVYVGRMPVYAALGTQMVVADRADDTLSAYPIATPGATPTTITLPSGAQPIFVTSAAGLMYVADFGLNSVSVVSPSTNSVLVTVPVDTHPVAMAATPDGKKMFVANRDSNTVSTISTVDNTAAAPLAVGSQPAYVVAHPSGNIVYVLNSGVPSISVVDTFTNTVAGTISLPAGGASNYMAFDSHLHRLYVTNPGVNSVSIFDATTSEVAPALLGEVKTGLTAPTVVAPLPDGSRVYVLNSGAAAGCVGEPQRGQVSVINTGSNAVAGCITVGAAPAWIAASSDSSKVFVPHQGPTTNNGSLVTPTGTSIISTNNSQVVELGAPFTDPSCTTDGGKAANGKDCVRMTPVFVFSP